MDYWVVDAFTDQPFRGNPAAVVFVERALTDEQLQARSLRWFTPAAEIELCGHATLASARALWASERESASEICFETLSGELRAGRDGETIALQFPALAVQPTTVDKALLQRLKLLPRQILKTSHYLLLELDSRQAVVDFIPDAALINQLPARGLIITAQNDSDQDPEVDFVSRFFAPRIGVPEDPVTGAVHCALAPYWGEKLEKKHLLAKQLSVRTGILQVTVAGDHVVLAGPAVTVMRGELAF